MKEGATSGTLFHFFDIVPIFIRIVNTKIGDYIISIATNNSVSATYRGGASLTKRLGPHNNSARSWSIF